MHRGRHQDRRSGRGATETYLTFAFASCRDTPHSFTTFHRHDEIELAYIERGSITQLLSHGPVPIPSHRLAIFWGAMPHRLQCEDPATIMHWLTLPVGWFLAWQLPDALTQAVLDGEVVIDPAPPDPISDLGRFTQWHADIRAGTAERRAPVLLEVEARLRRLAQVVKPGSAGDALIRRRRSLDGRGPVERMASFIARRYRDPIRMTDIAQAGGLHPDYATTLFRRSCGMGMLQYVLQQRLAHAQRLLITSEDSILSIALASGFGSASRFYAVFASACGVSPRAYRRQLRNGSADAS